MSWWTKVGVFPSPPSQATDNDHTVNRERQRSPEDTGPELDTETQEAPSSVSPSSSIVAVKGEDDPFVRALMEGPEHDSLPPQAEPRELSPESLAILLDRLDGMVEDNDARPRGALSSFAPSSPGRSGVVARTGRSSSLRAGLAIAAGLLAAGVAVLAWPVPAPERGRVERHAVEGIFAPDVRTVDLPAAPAAPRVEPLVETKRPDEPAAAEEPATAEDPATAQPQAAPTTGRVRVSGGSAEAFLRGRSLGKVPGELKLRAGRHHLLFRSATGVSFYRTVRVRRGEVVELALP